MAPFAVSALFHERRKFRHFLRQSDTRRMEQRQRRRTMLLQAITMGAARYCFWVSAVPWIDSMHIFCDSQTNNSVVVVDWKQWAINSKTKKEAVAELIVDGREPNALSFCRRVFRFIVIITNNWCAFVVRVRLIRLRTQCSY